MKRIFSLILTLLLIVTFPLNSIAEVVFYDTNHIGSPVAMWDKNGKKVWEGEYYPFGEEYRVSKTPQKNKKRFIGKEKDEETGLTYFGARYMDEKTGRFITPDPVRVVDAFSSTLNTKMLSEPQRLNRYAYGLNNPYMYVDPDGRDPGNLATGETEEVTRCHVNPHNDAKENLYGGAIIAGGLLAAFAPEFATAFAIAKKAQKTSKVLKNASGNLDNAAKAARTQPHQRQITDHANLRLKTRDIRVTNEALEATITRGKRNFYPATGKTVHNLPAKQSPTGRGVTAVTNHKGGVITVIDKGRKFNP